MKISPNVAPIEGRPTAIINTASIGLAIMLSFTSKEEPTKPRILAPSMEDISYLKDELLNVGNVSMQPYWPSSYFLDDLIKNTIILSQRWHALNMLDRKRSHSSLRTEKIRELWNTFLEISEEGNQIFYSLNQRFEEISPLEYFLEAHYQPERLMSTVDRIATCYSRLFALFISQAKTTHAYFLAFQTSGEEKQFDYWAKGLYAAIPSWSTFQVLQLFAMHCYEYQFLEPVLPVKANRLVRTY